MNLFKSTSVWHFLGLTSWTLSHLHITDITLDLLHFHTSCLRYLNAIFSIPNRWNAFLWSEHQFNQPVRLINWLYSVHVNHVPLITSLLLSMTFLIWVHYTFSVIDWNTMQLIRISTPTNYHLSTYSLKIITYQRYSSASFKSLQQRCLIHQDCIVDVLVYYKILSMSTFISG